MSQRTGEARFDGLWQRAMHGSGDSVDARELAGEARRARSEEARLLEEAKQKDAALADAYMTPSLLAWRAESPHGFSRVYADDAEQAQERGAMAQRCEAGAVTVTRWPEEDLCKASKKDATIAALADALKAMRAAFPHAYASQEEANAADAADAALRLAGRMS